LWALKATGKKVAMRDKQEGRTVFTLVEKEKKVKNSKRGDVEGGREKGGS